MLPRSPQFVILNAVKNLLLRVLVVRQREHSSNYEILSFDRPFAKLRAYSGQALRSG